jgi:hypothetical protein
VLTPEDSKVTHVRRSENAAIGLLGFSPKAVAKVFLATARATLIRPEPPEKKDDSKRDTRQSENCASHPTGPTSTTLSAQFGRKHFVDYVRLRGFRTLGD